ncbi:DUF5123 domain-containing protein [Bacteroides ihuae]|uniref:DUF5123 domain-containing protein n=1 Tax=Bacteroides ihuae TaxID=1852362 RepID=UPI0008DA10DC|nr:DUF5123 domain-containing protein [Bacteroides ihuae]
MKINKVKYRVLSVSLLLLTAFIAASCDNANDWTTDDAYNRLFHTTSISISPTATEAIVTWNATPKSSYYIIEVSKDSLYQDEVQSTSLVFGEDKSITKSPYTLTDLDSATKYYIRIRSCSETLTNSKWGYYEKYAFSTKSEQIMSSVAAADKTSSTVTLRWEAGKAVTSLKLLSGEIVVQTIALTAEDIANGSLTVTALSPQTAYTASIYNGEAKRGSVNFETYPDVPTSDKMIYLSAGDSINQTLFDGLASYSSATLAIPAGVLFANNDGLTIPDGLSVNFFGLPGESKAILSIKAITLSANHASIKFTNLDITGYIYENGTITSALNSYLFNQSAATTVSTISFDDCLVHDFANTPFRLQGSEAKTIGTLSFNNCIVTNLKDSYYFINADANKVGVINNISITNSTFNGVGRFILSKSTNTASILLDQCTFYNMIASGRYFIDFGGTSNGPSNGIAISNCLFALTQSATAKGIRSSATATVENSYVTSDWVFSSNAISGVTSYNGTSTDLFTDPTTGNFSIKDNSFSSSETCGDPRWRN